MDAFSASGQASVEKSSFKDDASASSNTSVAMSSDNDPFSASGQTLVDNSFYGDDASASCHTNVAMSSDKDVAAVAAQLSMSLYDDAVWVSKQTYIDTADVTRPLFVTWALLKFLQMMVM